MFFWILGLILAEYEIVKFPCFFILFAVINSSGGTLIGNLRDQNWYAQYQSNPYGVGYYEFAVNANPTNSSMLGGFDDTDIFGAFQMINLAAGTYTVASWDVWWRSAFAFNVVVPATGTSASVDLRLKATMWGYPVFWDNTGYYEFGQTFVATGPISMIYLRLPDFTGASTYTLTVHENGPGGTQVGVSRSFGTGDQRPIYGYNQMPTIAGRKYYVRIRTGSPGNPGVIRQMDPRPDYSDPMPGGCLYLGNAFSVTPYPDRDLGLVIMSDDDGLLTNLYCRQNGPLLSGTNVGQSFIARGVNLISVAFWLADPSAPAYRVRLLDGGPTGTQMGPVKVGKPARLNADPEMIVTWAPGECPVVTGRTYFLEITKNGGGPFYAVLSNNQNPFAYGQAYINGVPQATTDLAGTIMEEQEVGSAARPSVRILSGPTIAESNRGSNQLTVSWVTDVASDGRVEYALENPPYQITNSDPRLVTSHSVTITGLQAHTMYHYRVSSSATNYRTAMSRDLVICTRPAGSNLLVNPG